MIPALARWLCARRLARDAAYWQRDDAEWAARRLYTRAGPVRRDGG